jgi:5-methylcytosine-specific restriction endonuclease McrA
MADWDREIYARDGFKCRYCDLDGTTFPAWEFLQIDHFKPRWKGGTDNPKNLITACIRCNQINGGQDFPDVPTARATLKKIWADMRTHWETNVRPLVTKNSKETS